MISGINAFREWFRGMEEQYVIIGGTACDLLMEEESLTFRATKDIDMVLIVEAITPEFGKIFWEYVREAGYEHWNKSTGEVQFYRFMNPKNSEYPYMIELFSRIPDYIFPDENGIITPIYIDETVSSLSAILLNDEYYRLLQLGRIVIDGIPLLKAECLIPFKAKAWIDLCRRKESGEPVDSRHIRKHRNDVFRLTALLRASSRQPLEDEVFRDMKIFLDAMENETVDLKSLGIRGADQQQRIEMMQICFGIGRV